MCDYSFGSHSGLHSLCFLSLPVTESSQFSLLSQRLHVMKLFDLFNVKVKEIRAQDYRSRIIGLKMSFSFISVLEFVIVERQLLTRQRIK